MASIRQLSPQIQQNGPTNSQLQFNEQSVGHKYIVRNSNKQQFPTITVHKVHEDSTQYINKDRDTHSLNEHQQNNQLHYHQIFKNIQQPPQVQSSQKEINLQTNSIDENMECGQFQVIVHKIDSKQSIPENQDQYQILFTKSELEISIDQQEETENEKIPQQNYVNIWHKDNKEQDDIYLKMVELNWAQKEKEELSQNATKQQPSPQITQHIQNPNNFIQQLCINPSFITSEAPPQQNPLKKTRFVIKKIKDNRSYQATADTRKLKTLKQQRSFLQSKSQLLHLNVKTKAKHQHIGKKHVSNFQSVRNSPQKNQQLRKNKSQNVQYEMFLGNQIEKMSHILEDRCYNNFMTIKDKKNMLSPKVQENSKQKRSEKEQSVNKIRKIIKRSPYGILELQVKDNKNQAKITNLRILKPKQMIRLKKLPNIIKSNKENFLQ